MSWKDEARELWQSGLTWGEMAEHIQPKYFPDDDMYRVAERIRGCIRRYRKKNTPNTVLANHGLDSSKWEIVNYRHKDSESSVTAKPSNGLDLDHIESFFEKLKKEYVPVAAPYNRPDKRPLMAEVNIADLHLGKMCWQGISGSNYDHKIARKQFKDAIEHICAELSDRNIERILFVWANDYFNADTIDNKTTAGTPQDVDSRYEKLFDVGVELLIYAIDRLKNIAHVETFYTPSNHDKMSSFYAVRTIRAWYKDDPNVTVSMNTQPRKYYLYGNVLLGFCHGDQEGRESKTKERASRLASLMPIESPEMWGKAKYREMHVAHLHSEQMIQEINGVIVRRISSPTANDTWHVESAFVGQVRKCQTFLWDKEYGNVGTINTPILTS